MMTEELRKTAEYLRGLGYPPWLIQRRIQQLRQP